MCHCDSSFRGRVTTVTIERFPGPREAIDSCESLKSHAREPESQATLPIDAALDKSIRSTLPRGPFASATEIAECHLARYCYDPGKRTVTEIALPSTCSDPLAANDHFSLFCRSGALQRRNRTTAASKIVWCKRAVFHPGRGGHSAGNDQGHQAQDACQGRLSRSKRTGLKLLLKDCCPDRARQLVAALCAGKSRRRASTAHGRHPWTPAVPRTAALEDSSALPACASPPPGTASSPSSPNHVVLTGRQRHVLHLVRKGKSVFFTGAAGCGKSVLLRRIIASLPETTTAVTASTGVAACNIGGITLHSFAGLPHPDMEVDAGVEAVRRKRETLLRWQRTRVLIIDEISMIDGAFLDRLDELARRVRSDTRPFGGLQVIFSGDFFQLPPVTPRGETCRFAFESSCWKHLDAQVELPDVFRQRDPAFVRILNEIRWGNCSEESISALRERCGQRLDVSDGILPTRLFTHRKEVEEVNQLHLQQLSSAPVCFDASDTFMGSQTAPGKVAQIRRLLDSSVPARRQIRLKQGAQVILVKNLNPEEGLVNGARGVVERFQGQLQHPLVRFSNGLELVVRPEIWPVRVAGRVVAERKQVPLELAFALSVHRSQGMTLEAMEISLAKVFECGQAYVALSRARSLEGLALLDHFNPSCIRVNPKVVEFYEGLRSAESTSSVSRSCRKRPLSPLQDAVPQGRSPLGKSARVDAADGERVARVLRWEEEDDSVGL